MNETAFITLQLPHEQAVQETCGCELVQVRGEKPGARGVAFVPCDEHAAALGMDGDDMGVDEVRAPDEMEEVELPDPEGPEGYGCGAREEGE
jgi:hypothetical protein